MWFKIIGSILLAAAGVTAAAVGVNYERKRLEVLDGFLSLIAFIKGRIDSCAMPIGDILGSADDEILTVCRGGCGQGLDQMVRNCGYLLEREPKRLLRAFTQEFGLLRREEQLRRCDYYASELARERAKTADQLPSRIKAVSTVSVCVAAAVALLLW